MFHIDPARLDARPAPADAADPRALIERQVAVLSRLADIAMEIAEAAGRAATAAPSEDAPAAERPAPLASDPVLAYTRAARAVRLSFALQGQLLKDLAALDAGLVAETKARREALREVVDRGAAAEFGPAEWRQEAEFRREARERLSECEHDADLLGLPLPEAIARLCQDLQLSPEWTARAIAAAGGDTPPLPSPSGLSRGSMVQSQDDSGSRDGGMDPRDKPEDDGEDEDTFLEWPPPSG